jgi:hypothetical protein
MLGNCRECYLGLREPGASGGEADIVANKYTDADLRAFAEGALQPASPSAAWAAAARHLIAWSPSNVLEMLDRVGDLEHLLASSREEVRIWTETSERLTAERDAQAATILRLRALVEEACTVAYGLDYDFDYDRKLARIRAEAAK